MLAHHLQRPSGDPPGVIKRQGVAGGNHHVPDPGADGVAHVAKQPRRDSLLAGEGPDPLAEPRPPGRQKPAAAGLPRILLQVEVDHPGLPGGVPDPLNQGRFGGVVQPLGLGHVHHAVVARDQHGGPRRQCRVQPADGRVELLQLVFPLGRRGTIAVAGFVQLVHVEVHQRGLRPGHRLGRGGGARVRGGAGDERCRRAGPPGSWRSR